MILMTYPLQYIENKYSEYEPDQRFHFNFKPSSEYIELKFDAKQKEPTTGWTVQPHMIPCQVSNQPRH